ncbi:hypothetical protein FOA43_002626 [Brettanomyces nanus]|uniref:UBX domain-containing protein n=1 Tax=Eeniella nana TaxID=13502 RepID=A0A875S4I2_EENNA|nr:uncharacterized protein FOA43_002626 [Brettanomyces nanus]QPG75275.1 hypothetical protein FOA43_002626 [Brettanomyces nanus]
MLPDQEETLSQFQSILSSTLSRDEQIGLLESHDWNIELALLAYNEQHPLEARSVQLQSQTSSNRSQMSDYLLRDGSTAVQPSKIHRIFNRLLKVTGDALVYLIIVPFYLLYKLIGLILLIFVGYLTPVVRKIQQNRHYKLVKKLNDPTDVARRFIMEFDEMIGNRVKPENDDDAADTPLEIDRPDFLECAYSQALYTVKKEARWLMIYVHSEEHEFTQHFVNGVLLNAEFLQLIRDRGFLCWGGSIKESESFLVTNQFKVSQLPFLGLLCLTVNQTPTASGMQQSAPILSLVCKIQGDLNVDEVIARMRRAYDKFNPTVANLRAEYERHSQARLMRKLQDQAYEKSLQRDKERRLEKERQDKQEQLEKQWRRWRKSMLRPEMDLLGEYARVAIRLPDGGRKQFKFDKHCKLEELYAYVECMHEQLTDGEVVAKPEGFQYKYTFKIVSVMPRKEVEPDETTELKDCTAVYPSGNLIVEM